MNHTAMATIARIATMRQVRTDASEYLKMFIVDAAAARTSQPAATVIAPPRNARLARYRLRTPRTTPSSSDCSDGRPCTVSIGPSPLLQCCHPERDATELTTEAPAAHVPV